MLLFYTSPEVYTIIGVVSRSISVLKICQLLLYNTNKNGKVSFRLPNFSVIRIYTTVQAKSAQK